MSHLPPSRWRGAALAAAVAAGLAYLAVVLPERFRLTAWWESICLPAPECGRDGWRRFWGEAAVWALIALLLGASVAALARWALEPVGKGQPRRPMPRWAAAVAATILVLLAWAWVQ